MEKLIKRLADLKRNKQIATLAGCRRGIEKECLRVDKQSQIAQTPHPKVLGAALTHGHITTDYSEALLEFITPAYEDLTDSLLFLDDAHHFTYLNLGEEMLWTNSMPSILPDEEDIPIAQYGTSNIGQMKTAYRHGLWHRYGRSMQTIAGIHYNFSLPNNFWHALAESDGYFGTKPETSNDEQRDLQTYISTQYFSLIRNFHRLSWLPIYLFGSTPAVCTSFLKNNTHSLEPLGDKTFYAPYATSLRLSDIGYQNNVQSSLNVCYNKVETYIDTLEEAMRTPLPQYQDIGLRYDNGDYKQLSENILQIENEYYGMIRPKRTALSGERPSNALRKRGVEYIEMRLLDIDPYSAMGLDESVGCFMEVFALYCLLIDSPYLSPEECLMLKENTQTAVLNGRNPAAKITLRGKNKTLLSHGLDVVEAMQSVAEALDSAYQTTAYTDSLGKQKEKLEDVSKTPSARFLSELQTTGKSFVELATDLSAQHKKHFMSLPLRERRKSFFEQQALESHRKQQIIEQEDTIDFTAFLAQWFE